MRPLLTNAIKYFQLAFIFVTVSSLGVLMGEKSLLQKYKLEEKKHILLKENNSLISELGILERKSNLLKSDKTTIENAAKRKLGMVSPNETIYLFQNKLKDPETKASLEQGRFSANLR